MLNSRQSIARFLFRLNIVPGVLSLICVMLPNPVIWALIAAGLYLVYGYWRQMRGESAGLEPRGFWFTSLGVNLLGAAAYILFLGGELRESSALVVMALGSIWTFGTALLSWRAAQLSANAASQQTQRPESVRPANL
jgi:hypothetical protein